MTPQQQAQNDLVAAVKVYDENFNHRTNPLWALHVIRSARAFVDSLEKGEAAADKEAEGQPKSIFQQIWDETPSETRQEVAALRAQVAQLTKDRDEARQALEDVPIFSFATDRIAALESDLATTRKDHAQLISLYNSAVRLIDALHARLSQINELAARVVKQPIGYGPAGTRTDAKAIVSICAEAALAAPAKATEAKG